MEKTTDKQSLVGGTRLHAFDWGVSNRIFFAIGVDQVSEERPRLSLHSAEWPAELVAQRKLLGRRAMWRSWKMVLGVSIVVGLACGFVTLFWFNGPKWVRFILFVLVQWTGTFAMAMAMRRRTRDDVARLLVDNGYCVCGYPYQTKGIIRLCPECGRQWTEKALPQD